MKALNLVDNTDESIDYINTIHGDSKGWITKAEISKNKEFSQWHYLVGDLLKQDFDKENIYISMSTFYKPIRRIETIKEIGSLFIDLDTYNTQFTKTQILMNLEYNYYNKSIPTPNLIIDSGRGLTLVWSIEKVPYIALPLWKAIQEYLYSQLKEFGADRKALDVTRILRVPGSINSKSGTRVSILEKHEYKYTLREIQNEFLPYLDENRNKKKGRPKKVVYIHRERSLYQNRILDIVKLCELRNYDVKGHREIILFLYRYYLCYFYEDEQKALEDVLELNKEFIQPLGERELIRATGSAEKVFKSKDKQYKYKNETLIELLEISEYEQTNMKIIIGKEEYKRRENIRVKKVYKEKLKSQGRMTKKEELKILREKIKVLRDEGLKNKEISDELNVPLKTLKRHITYMKNTLIFSIIMLVIGTCLLITGFIIEQNGSEANPMFFGLGCGLGVAGLVNTIQAIKLIKNPEKCEEIEMLKTEERTVFLRDKNNSMVYSIFLYVECLIVIITSFLGYRSISLVLSFLLCAKLITWFVIGTINVKKY